MKSPLSRSLIKYGITLISTSLITGCATAPPTQEMSDARQSVEAAESIGANRHAPAALNSAQQLLSKAQDDLKAGEYEEAQKEAVAAREAARQAMAISHAKQTTTPALETAPHAAKPQEELHTQPHSPATPQPELYTVRKHDSLWNIAAKNSVYGDPLLWPLLLKSNANEIHDADLILPGLVLTIDPGPSEHEKQAARQHAKLRGTTAHQAKDASYLSQYGLR